VKTGKRLKAKGKRPGGRQAVKPGSTEKEFRLYSVGFLHTLLPSQLLTF
jgi:hypothetical protein